ncbi:hypothetical protein BH11MYX4_BH11MYX4_68670 [soil metagenome]
MPSSPPPRRSHSWLVAITPPTAFLLLYACSTFDSGPDAVDASVDASSAADAVAESALADASNPDAGLEDARDANAGDASDRSCAFMSGGLTSASSGGTSCERQDHYTCPGGNQTITCDCPLAKCTCTDGGLVPFSCDGGGCKIGDAQRAACGFAADGGS